MLKLTAIVLISLGSATAVNAQSTASLSSSANCPFLLQVLNLCPKNPPGGSPAHAPEIDPASAMSALTLLTGGLAVLRGRRQKKK